MGIFDESSEVSKIEGSDLIFLKLISYRILVEYE